MILKVLIFALAVPSILCVDPIQLATLIDPSPLVAAIHPCNSFSRTYEPNPRGCSWFWLCRENGDLLEEPLEGMCPDDLHFNFINQTCTYDDGFCSLDDDIFNRTPTRCTNYRMDLIPHVFDCSQYYLCWETNATVLDCDSGKHFSYFQNECVDMKLADCRAEHNYCRRMRNENVRAKKSPYSCETYHVCNECNNRFSLLKFECASGSHQFNEEYQHCDVVTNVTCTNLMPNPIDPSSMPPEPFSIQCTAANALQGFVIHPTNCHYYFNCASGRSRLLKCPGNSYFNLERSQCVDGTPPVDCIVPPTT